MTSSSSTTNNSIPHDPTVNQNSFIAIVVRGALILIPVVALIYFVYKLSQTLKDNISKILEITKLDSVSQLLIAFTVTLLGLILITYIIGYLSTRNSGLKIAKKIDQQLENSSTVYRNIKLKIDNTAQFRLLDKQPIYMRFDDCEQPGFLMTNANEKGLCIVFIPSDFRNFEGAIFIVSEDRIRVAHETYQDFIYALDHLGTGLNIS